jgi:MFS family permease
MRLWRYCLAGFLYDWLAFVFGTVVPIRAKEFGASATQLAILQAAQAMVYVLICLVMGRLSDRISRSWLARAGAAGAIVACLLLTRAGTLAGLLLVAPVMGLAAGVYWPGAQGAIGAEAEPARLERALGTFNVTWSIGKSLGFAMAGWLVASQGHVHTLWIAAAVAVPIILIYPRDVRSHAAVLREEGHPDRTAFRTMGYIANFVAFGVGATLQIQFFKYLDDGGLGNLWNRKTYFGILLGIIFAAQTAAFVVLQRGRGWTYRRSLLYSAQLLVASMLLAITAAKSDVLMLALAPFVGIGLGFICASSIYYSLHGPSDHGKYAGLHEAVLGAGTFLVPFAGGWLADRAGDLRMPYWLAAGVMSAAILIEEGLYRRRSTS